MGRPNSDNLEFNIASRYGSSPTRWRKGYSSLLRSPRTRFNIADGGTATVGGRQTRVVLLTPKGRESFTKAKVWIDAGNSLVRRFEVTQASGLVRNVTLTSIAANVAVPASAFRFTPPRGTRVIDQAQLGRGQ